MLEEPCKNYLKTKTSGKNRTERKELLSTAKIDNYFSKFLICSVKCENVDVDFTPEIER